MKAAFQHLAEYIRLHEPTTLSYMWYDSDKDETQAYIYERYVNKNAYLEIHRKSDAFLKFRDLLTSYQSVQEVTIDGHSYLESNLGFVDSNQRY